MALSVNSWHYIRLSAHGLVWGGDGCPSLQRPGRTPKSAKTQLRKNRGALAQYASPTSAHGHGYSVHMCISTLVGQLIVNRSAAHGGGGYRHPASLVVFFRGRCLWSFRRLVVACKEQQRQQSSKTVAALRSFWPGSTKANALRASKYVRNAYIACVFPSCP